MVPASPTAPVASTERRDSGRRSRARDRLFDRAHREAAATGALAAATNCENLLLFVDDDLRETALSLTRIEHFLVQVLGLLEDENMTRADVQEVAHDVSVLDHLDQLNETMESLRRRLAKLCANMR